MRYSNSSEVLTGTRQFGLGATYASQAHLDERIDSHHDRSMTNSGEKNGGSKMFTITIDPQKLYTLGVSRFTLCDMTLGIRNGAFTEGTEFMSPTGRVRIINGKLRYTHNKAIYKLPDIRV